MQCGLQSNFLQNNSFQLILPRFPLVQYYSTNFVLPDIVLPPSNVSTPFSDIAVPGDKLLFGELNFTFIVDDDLKNYEEVLNWITSISFAESHKDFTEYKNKDIHQQLGQQDATVVFLSGKGNRTRSITYKDAFPVALGGFQMTTNDPDTNYVVAKLTMKYSGLELK